MQSLQSYMFGHDKEKRTSAAAEHPALQASSPPVPSAQRSSLHKDVGHDPDAPDDVVEAEEWDSKEQDEGFEDPEYLDFLKQHHQLIQGTLPLTQAAAAGAFASLASQSDPTHTAPSEDEATRWDGGGEGRGVGVGGAYSPKARRLVEAIFVEMVTKNYNGRTLAVVHVNCCGVIMSEYNVLKDIVASCQTLMMKTSIWWRIKFLDLMVSAVNVQAESRRLKCLQKLKKRHDVCEQHYEKAHARIVNNEREGTFVLRNRPNTKGI
ncbi:hypothetical protein Q5P01_021799 [Channa striata]|uniref:Uncharacterized protein n=1 Tax=Channa striata TaxID=64152 RepID=A0AA88LUR6_CHASR|nr:hypothetical protein Q5P01_021799 [Channa striata]